MNSMGRHLNVDLLVGSHTHSVSNWLSLLNISLLKKPIDLKGLKFTHRFKIKFEIVVVIRKKPNLNILWFLLSIHPALLIFCF